MFNFIYPKLESFGLDLSDRSIKVAKVIANQRGHSLLASYGSLPLERGILEGGRVLARSKLAGSIREAVHKASGRRIATRAVVVGLPEEQCFVRVIQLPAIPMKELPEAVAIETEGNIPLAMNEVYYDWQIVTRPEGMGKGSGEGKHFDILVAATPREIVDEYEALLEEAGLLPVIFEPESFAIARAVLRSRISYSPLLLVDLGETHVTLAIVSGTSVRVTASVPVASDTFTDLIASSLKISYAEAERKKQESGIGQEGEGLKIFEILKPQIEDLVQQIKGYLSFYSSHSFHEHQVWTLAVKTPESKAMGTFDFRPVSRGEVLVGRESGEGRETQFSSGSGIARIFLTGGGANLAGLAEYLAANLKLSIQRADPFVNIVPPSGGKEGFLPFDPLTFATAIGLAMRQPGSMV